MGNQKVEVRHGCSLTGCIIPSFGCLTMIFVVLVIIGICSTDDDKTSPAIGESEQPVVRKALSLEQAQEEVATGRELVSWLRRRHERTSVQDEADFDRFDGKWVLFKGTVENVSDGWSGVDVELVVGKLDALQRAIIEFNVAGAYAAEARKWNKGDVRILRGRIKSLDLGLISDVSCSCCESLTSSQLPLGLTL